MRQTLFAGRYGSILRLRSGQEGFERIARVTIRDQWGMTENGIVRHITVARDGTLWVAAAGSVLRITAEGEVEEYAWHLDPERYAVPTSTVHIVVETIDGHIVAFGSDDSPHVREGVVLTGGPVIFRNGRFEAWEPPLASAEAVSPFATALVTSYTPIDHDTAILGTTEGFVRQRGGVFERMAEVGDPSYDALLRERPQVWLGRQGVRVGDDHWLFPTAGGLVELREGIWRFAEEIHAQIPGFDALADHGVRVIHAVAVDPNGVLYVGTDQGIHAIPPSTDR